MRVGRPQPAQQILQVIPLAATRLSEAQCAAALIVPGPRIGSQAKKRKRKIRASDLEHVEERGAAAPGSYHTHRIALLAVLTPKESIWGAGVPARRRRACRRARRRPPRNMEFFLTTAEIAAGTTGIYMRVTLH